MNNYCPVICIGIAVIKSKQTIWFTIFPFIELSNLVFPKGTAITFWFVRKPWTSQKCFITTAMCYKTRQDDWIFLEIINKKSITTARYAHIDQETILGRQFIFGWIFHRPVKNYISYCCILWGWGLLFLCLFFSRWSVFLISLNGYRFDFWFFLLQFYFLRNRQIFFLICWN